MRGSAVPSRNLKNDYNRWSNASQMRRTNLHPSNGVSNSSKLTTPIHQHNQRDSQQKTPGPCPWAPQQRNPQQPRRQHRRPPHNHAGPHPQQHRITTGPLVEAVETTPQHKTPQVVATLTTPPERGRNIDPHQLDTPLRGASHPNPSTPLQTPSQHKPNPLPKCRHQRRQHTSLPLLQSLQTRLP